MLACVKTSAVRLLLLFLARHLPPPLLPHFLPRAPPVLSALVSAWVLHLCPYNNCASKLSFPHGFIVCEKKIHLLALFVSSMYHLCKDVQLSLKSSFPHGFKTTHLPLLSRFLPQVPSIVPSTIAHGFVICDKKCLRTWNKYVSASLASLQVQTATIWSRSQVARNKSCFGFADASFNRCLL